MNVAIRIDHTLVPLQVNSVIHILLTITAPEVSAEELGGVLKTVAQNVEARLYLADGVTGVAQLTDFPWKSLDTSCDLMLGDFHEGQTKNVLLAVVLPAVDVVSDMLVATLDLMYAESKEESLEFKHLEQPILVKVSNAYEADSPGDPEVLLHIERQRAEQLRKETAAKLDEG